MERRDVRGHYEELAAEYDEHLMEPSTAAGMSS